MGCSLVERVPTAAALFERSELLSALRRVELFGVLNGGQLKALASAMVACEYKKGSNVFTQGEGGDHFHVILEGEAEILRAEGHAKAIAFGKMAKRSSFGERGLLPGHTRPLRGACDVGRAEGRWRLTAQSLGRRSGSRWS